MNPSHNPFQDVLDESFTVRDPDGKVVHTSYTDSGAKKKAAELTQQTGKTHTTGYSRTAMVPHKKMSSGVSENTLHEAHRPGHMKFADAKKSAQ